jgi:hypothetical protein
METQTIFELAENVDKLREEPQLRENKYYHDLKDSQNGIYNSSQEVSFDMPSLAMQKHVSFRDSYLEIPWQVSLTSENVDLRDNLREAIALKGSNTMLINSNMLTIDGVQLINFTPHTEIPAQFVKATKSNSQYNDVMANSADSFVLDDGKIVYEPTIMGEYHQSSAIAKKHVNTHLYDDAGSFTEKINLKNARKNVYTVVDKRTHIWDYIIRIKITDLFGGFFDSIDLCKGLYCKMAFQFHNADYEFKTTAGVITDKTYQSTHGVCPYYFNNSMFSSITPTGVATGVTNGLVTTAAESIIKIKSEIRQTLDSPSPNQLLQNCRIRAAIYIPDLKKEQMLLSRPPLKMNYYQPQYHNFSVGPQVEFEHRIIANTRKCTHILIHQELAFNGSTNIKSGGFNGLVAKKISSFNSPFSSAPATCKPNASLTNFNVILGGTALFTKGNISDSFEMYRDNFVNFNSTHGGRFREELTQGLISKEMWDDKYGWLLIDLRKYESEAEFSAPRDISVTGYNNSPCGSIMHYFGFNEKELTLDLQTGKIVV